MQRSPAASYLSEKTIRLLGFRHLVLSFKFLCLLRSREINILPQDPTDSWLSRPDFGSVGFLASKLSRDRKPWKRLVLNRHLPWEQERETPPQVVRECAWVGQGLRGVGIGGRTFLLP